MDHIFLKVVNMSINAGYVILVVLFARLFLKKAPKIFSYALWFVVLLRLLCPFTIVSSFGILPADQLSLMKIAFYDYMADIQESTSNSNSDVSTDRKTAAGTDTSQGVDSTMVTDSPAPSQSSNEERNADTGNSVMGSDSGQGTQLIQQSDVLDAAVANENSSDLSAVTDKALQIIETVWIAGMLVLAGYSILSLVKVKKCIASASQIDKNVFEKDGLGTPFVFGLIRPRIYLPAGLEGEEREYILEHEKMHIRRFDHVVKLIAFFALILHWMNPLVWISFVLLTKDMEMSCDEAVIRRMGMNIKKDYSASLLNMATERTYPAGTPLAFGEGNVKGRIRNILHYKKAGIGIILLCITVVAVISLFLATNLAPQSEDAGSEQYDITGLENKTYPSNLKQMYQWRTEYIGDNSAVGNITDAWFTDADTPLKKEGFELQTAAEPYEVTVRYQSKESEDSAYIANVVNLEKDAALFFSLVHNAGLVTISINDYSMETFTRTAMEEKFGDLWTMSESYEGFCKTYDYITYLQGTSASEEDTDSEENIVSLDAVMDRLTETIGTDNALPFHNTADVLSDKDALVKLCESQDGEYEAYGCISPEYGFQGIILNNIIDGEQNLNYLHDEWNYQDVPPELITMDQTQVHVAFMEPVYDNNVITKKIRYFTGHDTGIVTEIDQPGILLQEDDIFKISVTNGNTGEKIECSRLDSNTGFLNLLSKYEGMMFEISEKKAERISGYQYAFSLYDHQDTLLQTFYLQGNEIDVAGDTRYQEAGLGSMGELYLAADAMFGSNGSDSAIAPEAAFTSQIDQKGEMGIPGVQMIVTYSTDSTANVVLTNTTDVELFYGSWFGIEKKENGQWQAAAIDDDSLAFEDIAYNLPIGGISSWQVNWSSIYGKLPAGEYRIVKSIENVTVSDQESENTPVYISAEFTVQ